MRRYMESAKRKAAAIRNMSADVPEAMLYTHKAALMPWRNGESYARGEAVVHAGRYYICETAHTASEQAGWTPATPGALWREIANPAEEWPAWMPHTVYNTGDKVTHSGRRYVCKADNIAHSPEAYPAGWEEA